VVKVVDYAYEAFEMARSCEVICSSQEFSSTELWIETEQLDKSISEVAEYIMR
jgi:hypothetical protein